jgi:TonB family protein
MRLFIRVSTYVVASMALSSALPIEFSAQDITSSESAQIGVVLTKLSPPVYPPLARKTCITGDVDLTINVLRDGSVASALVITGNPLLQEAALESAEQSKYKCRKCSEATTAFHLTYTFQLVSSQDCRTANASSPNKGEQDQPFPHVTQSRNQVTVVDQPLITSDPAPDRSKARSVKCLYLWKCRTS